MRCSAYCTAEKFKLKNLFNYFKEKGWMGRFYRDVLYVHDKSKLKEIFFFPIGSVVFWNITSREEKKWLEALTAFQENPIEIIEKDFFTFFYSEKTSLTTHDRFNTDIIMLESNDPQIKLAIAFGLAQSVKLEVYEEKVQTTIRKNKSLPIQLAEHGKISLSRKAISKRMGEIYLERSSVNLSSEYLEMPEYFWRYPALEDYYIITKKFLDISQRAESLNKKLDVLHDLFNILTSQLQHRHSSLLETIIIILIAIEIIVNLSGWWFQL